MFVLAGEGCVNETGTETESVAIGYAGKESANAIESDSFYYVTYLWERA